MRPVKYKDRQLRAPRADAVFIGWREPKKRR